MGWTTHVTILRFTSAAKPTSALPWCRTRGGNNETMNNDESYRNEKTPAVGGGRGWVLETGCRRVSRHGEPARIWLAIGKEGVRQARATIRSGSGLADAQPGMTALRVLSAEYSICAISAV
jgi:hypothetical protein